MELGEATDVLTMLAAAFPRRWRNAPAEETQLWIELLASFPSAEVGREAAGKIVRESHDMPSIAEFRQAYFAAYKEAARSLPAASADFDDANMPHGREEWERAAARAREWRKSEYPGTKDPAEGSPLPQNRREFGAEWVQWMEAHFGWSPVSRASVLNG